jgi:hypothetical protein
LLASKGENAIFRSMVEKMGPAAFARLSVIANEGLMKRQQIKNLNNNFNHNNNSNNIQNESNKNGNIAEINKKKAPNGEIAPDDN